MQKLLAEKWELYIVFLTFLLVAVLTLMNMLIGILCDVVSNVAESTKEDHFVKEVEGQTMRLSETLDIDGSGGISKDEFDIIIKDPFMTASFHSLGVDVVAVAHFANFVFDQCDEISYSDFVVLVSKFRGNKMATVKDVMDIRQYVTTELLELEARLPLTQLPTSGLNQRPLVSTIW